MTKTTYKQLGIFRNASIAYIEQNKAETKLRIVLQEQLEASGEVLMTWLKKVKELEFEHAAVDKDGCVLYTILPDGSRKYKHTKEGLKALDKELDELYIQEDMVEVSPREVEFPADLHESWEEAFRPFVIKK